jgi:hypothetical protein
MKVDFKIQLLDKMGPEETYNSMSDYVDLVNLVRSIQRTENNIDCYRRGRQQCDQMRCVWRDHCLKAPEEPSKVGSESHQSKIATDPKQEQDSYPEKQN